MLRMLLKLGMCNIMTKAETETLETLSTGQSSSDRSHDQT